MSSRNRKITQNKSKHLLVENELTTLKIKYLILVVLLKKTDYNTKVGEIDTKLSNLDGKIGKTISNIVKSFIFLTMGNALFNEGDGSQVYLIFQPVCKYFKLLPILIIFHHGNRKDYLMKVLSVFLHLIIVLHHN